MRIIQIQIATDIFPDKQRFDREKGGHGVKEKERGAGEAREMAREKERERAQARETTLQLLISMHHLSILAPTSLIDFHSADCMAARYPGAIFNHLAFVDSYLRGAQKIAVERITLGGIHVFTELLMPVGKINAAKNGMTRYRVDRI